MSKDLSRHINMNIENGKGYMPQEVKDSLIISSKDLQITDQEIARQIAAWQLPRTDYRSVPQARKAIHDLYFDTPKCVLQKKKITLRVREVHNVRILTIKIPSRPDKYETKRDDSEFERPWSKDGLQCIIKELAKSGIELPDFNQQNLYLNQNAHNAMKGVGLEVVQDRDTNREIRNVVQ